MLQSLAAVLQLKPPAVLQRVAVLLLIQAAVLQQVMAAVLLLIQAAVLQQVMAAA
ncbi:MAG: hypothetical protein NTX48_03945 [Planctomycetales bacterium]|nr:hypothetical protein [Planctomycetales bacterium]